jgi:hypothetical protein
MPNDHVYSPQEQIIAASEGTAPSPGATTDDAALKQFIGWTMAEAAEARLAFKSGAKADIVAELIDVMNTALAALGAAFQLDEICAAYCKKLSDGKGKHQAAVLSALASSPCVMDVMRQSGTATWSELMDEIKIALKDIAHHRKTTRDHSHLVD